MKDDGVELRSSRCVNDQNAKKLGNFDKKRINLCKIVVEK